jgi:hypothetical protein
VVKSIVAMKMHLRWAPGSIPGRRISSLYGVRFHFCFLGWRFRVDFACEPSVADGRMVGRGKRMGLVS